MTAYIGTTVWAAFHVTLVGIDLRMTGEPEDVPPLARFAVQDRDLWERGYAAEAARSYLPVARTLDGALALVAPVLDPLLDGSAEGAWRPADGRWSA